MAQGKPAFVFQSVQHFGPLWFSRMYCDVFTVITSSLQGCETEGLYKLLIDKPDDGDEMHYQSDIQHFGDYWHG